MLEVLLSAALVSLLSLSLIQGGVYLQRESKRAEQSLLVLQHMENYLEYARIMTITGSASDSQWQGLEDLGFEMALSSSHKVSSLRVQGTKLEITASWINPWGQSESAALSTWVAFH
ncbi:hypothetical protein VIN01S_01050 [Vibrio inusitatus NBRC 102082]|uniref:Uncharacterized protein n=1 Tax=Vibrio inusitatus NBRC 102082 TaxID=1219070 RepID=A0A4Y3HQW4_9VIBR|nr:hypothetical protein [Vibrio inusitatus]GEA49301.1 hypothetical protein VIN01S_01050 [Vibrio inusitatus NBRC 102082]